MVVVVVDVVVEWPPGRPVVMVVLYVRLVLGIGGVYQDVLRL